MRIGWGFGCIGLAIAVAFVLGGSNFLLIDSLYAMLAGAVVGILFMLALLVSDGPPEHATKLLCIAVAGSIVGFACAWGVAIVLRIALHGNAALAFDLFAGAVGAAVAASHFFDSQQLSTPHSINQNDT